MRCSAVNPRCWTMDVHHFCAYPSGDLIIFLGKNPIHTDHSLTIAAFTYFHVGCIDFATSSPALVMFLAISKNTSFQNEKKNTKSPKCYNFQNKTIIPINFPAKVPKTNAKPSGRVTKSSSLYEKLLPQPALPQTGFFPALAAFCYDASQQPLYVVRTQISWSHRSPVHAVNSQ